MKLIGGIEKKNKRREKSSQSSFFVEKKDFWERAEEATVKSGGEPLSELIRSGAGCSRRKRGRGLCLVSVQTALLPPAVGMEPFLPPSSFFCFPFFFGRVVGCRVEPTDSRLARLLVATLSGGRDEGALEPLENQIEAAFR